MALFGSFRKKNENDRQKSINNKKYNESIEVGKDIETQRKGFLELSEICLNESNKSDFSEFIETLTDYTDDEEYMTTLNFVIDCLYQKKRIIL